MPRNLMGLTLPPTVAEQSEAASVDEIKPSAKRAVTHDSTTTRPEPQQVPVGQRNSRGAPLDSADSLEREIAALQLTDTQKHRLEEWQVAKRRVGDLKAEELEKVCDLGYGNGGAVVKVKHVPSGTFMARKLIHLEVNQTVRRQIINELRYMHSCESPYIVGFYGAFSSDGDMSICMEYMDGRSLDKLMDPWYVGKFSEPILSKIAYAVCHGLAYLKEKLNILHRDVKPSNILVNTQGEIKLCDFGVSGQLINSMANSFVGTRSYMAPERLTGGHYDIRSDVWSLGVSLVELAIGRYPIPAPTAEEYARIFGKEPSEIQMAPHGSSGAAAGTDNPPRSAGRAPNSAGGGAEGPQRMAIFELLDYIVIEPPPLLPRNLFSSMFIDFTDKCLSKSTKERAHLRTLLEHPFLKKCDEEKVDFSAWVDKALNGTS